MFEPAANAPEDQRPATPVDTLAAAGDDIASSAATTPAPALGGELSGWPTYARGLLKIRVPVHVTLASHRKSIQEITELGPGSIVKFDKTCDEPLDLMVGDRRFAQGEVVKIGDKFGLRIRGLVGDCTAEDA
jgi:flagellar motor switch protein FliN